MLLVCLFQFFIDRRPWAALCPRRTHICSGLRWLLNIVKYSVILCLCIIFFYIFNSILICASTGCWWGEQQRAHARNPGEAAQGEEGPAQPDEGGGCNIFSLIFCSTKWRKRSQRLLFVHFWFNLMKREVAEPILFLSLWRNLKLVTKLIVFLFRMRTAWRWSLRWTRRLPSSREPARSQRLATSTAESHL